MTRFGLGADSEPVSLSALEFDVLWEHLRLGSMPVIVTVPSPGKTHTERAQLEERVWADLGARGLGRPGEVDPDLHDLLEELVRPEREVDARTWVGAGLRVLAAATGDNAVLAALRGDQVSVQRLTSVNLPSAVIDLLPPAPAGPGRSVTLRSEDFESAAKAGGSSQQEFDAALRARGVRGDDTDALVSMINDVTGNGNFGAAARDKLGKRYRAERVVAFFETEAGRYVQIRRVGADGSPWTTISPVDVRRLTQHVDELHDEVVRQAGS